MCEHYSRSYCKLKRFPLKSRKWQLTHFLTFVSNSSKFAVEEDFQRTNNKKELGKCTEVWELAEEQMQLFSTCLLVRDGSLQSTLMFHVWGHLHLLLQGLLSSQCLKYIFLILWGDFCCSKKINWSLHYCWTSAMGVLESGNLAKLKWIKK